MDYQKLIVERQGRIGVVRINHPEALNALDTLVLRELGQAFDAFAADADIDVVVLTGEGRAFVAGADIAEMSAMTAAEGKAFGRLGTAKMVGRQDGGRVCKMERGGVYVPVNDRAAGCLF